MENENKYISLQEATKYCDYSQEYLALRVRQGKLKATKIGRNWVTKKEWLEEYLRVFGNKETENKDQFVPLQEATKYCNYSQEYLALRARQGKLKATKIGRNWVTKKEWLEEYLKVFGEKEIEKKTTPQFKKAEPPPNLPVETSTQKLEISIVEKSEPRIRLRLATVFIFILFLEGIFLLGRTKPNLFPEGIKDNYQKATVTIMEIGSGEVQASTIDVFKRYAFWLKGNLESRVPGFEIVYSAADNFVNRKLVQVGHSVLRPFSRFYQLVFSPEKKPETEEQETLGLKEGIVVVPSEGKDEEIKRKIKEAFSDEVRVEIKDETSGFIVPIFKEKEGEKYLYLMVPMKN